MFTSHYFFLLLPILCVGLAAAVGVSHNNKEVNGAPWFILLVIIFCWLVS